MQNEDNTCIKYLMKELDPSEAVLVERRMMEDEDFLIEVECMRKTLQRLDDLPRLDPPANLTSQICRQAAEYRSSQKYSSSFFPQLSSIHTKYYAAAAAVVAFSLAFGVLTFSETENRTNTSEATGTQKNTPVQAAQMGSSHKTGSTQRTSQASAESNDLKPWVDRNNILYFKKGHNNSSAAQLDSAIERSMQKLKPIDEPVHNLFNSPNYRLTGSPAQR